MRFVLGGITQYYDDVRTVCGVGVGNVLSSEAAVTGGGGGEGTPCFGLNITEKKIYYQMRNDFIYFCFFLQLK